MYQNLPTLITNVYGAHAISQSIVQSIIIKQSYVLKCSSQEDRGLLLRELTF